MIDKNQLGHKFEFTVASPGSIMFLDVDEDRVTEVPCILLTMNKDTAVSVSASGTYTFKRDEESRERYILRKIEIVKACHEHPDGLRLPEVELYTL